MTEHDDDLEYLRRSLPSFARPLVDLADRELQGGPPIAGALVDMADEDLEELKRWTARIRDHARVDRPRAADLANAIAAASDDALLDRAAAVRGFQAEAAEGRLDPE